MAAFFYWYLLSCISINLMYSSSSIKFFRLFSNPFIWFWDFTMFKSAQIGAFSQGPDHYNKSELWLILSRPLLLAKSQTLALQRMLWSAMTSFPALTPNFVLKFSLMLLWVKIFWRIISPFTWCFFLSYLLIQLDNATATIQIISLNLLWLATTLNLKRLFYNFE